jgi:hypothetical protein
MKAFGKKLSKLVNLAGDSIDLNSLKEKEKKIDIKYKRNITKLDQQLHDLKKDEDEIKKLYEFRERYSNIIPSEVTEVTEVTENEEKDSDDSEEEKEKDNVTQPSSIRDRINLVFSETIHKLNIIEKDITHKKSEIQQKRDEMQREYERVKEVIHQKLRDKRDKIHDKKKALF